MTENGASPAASPTGDVTQRERGPGRPSALPYPPAPTGRPLGWTAWRVTALVTGSLLVLISMGKLSGGAVLLWADRTQRDSGYVTTNVHEYSTAGSALATDPSELGSPGVGWLYSTVLLGQVRIRVTPVSSDSAVFVGIGPTTDVDRYLAGVSHTLITDYWGNRVEVIGGGAPAAAPEAQNFWVASASGTGLQTLTWDPANGSWTVVVMGADGRPGIDVRTDLGATLPVLPWIAVAFLLGGVLFLIGGVLLIVGAIRRAARGRGGRSVR